MEASPCPNHRMISLHPSLPSGTHRHCYSCKEYDFVPTARCTCSETKQNFYNNPNYDQPKRGWRPGWCHVCEAIIPGEEDEADTYSCNW